MVTSTVPGGESFGAMRFEYRTHFGRTTDGGLVVLTFFGWGVDRSSGETRSGTCSIEPQHDVKLTDELYASTGEEHPSRQVLQSLAR